MKHFFEKTILYLFRKFLKWKKDLYIHKNEKTKKYTTSKTILKFKQGFDFVLRTFLISKIQ